MALSAAAPATGSPVDFAALGEGLTFSSLPFERQTEITGPLAAKLFVSSSTTDADLFLVFRVFAPDGEEVVFQGALDPHTPVGQGWLRASHRRLDPSLTTFYRPYHSHDALEPLTPGEIVELDIEIWPTCIVVPRGYRVALTVRGKDYEYSGPAAHLSNMKNPMRGCGPFVHDDPQDRPPQVFGGTTTLHVGPAIAAVSAGSDRAGYRRLIAENRLFAASPPALPQSDLHREPRSRGRVARSDHRVVPRQAPLLAILIG